MKTTKSTCYNFEDADIEKAINALIEDENISNGTVEAPVCREGDEGEIEVKVSFTFSKEDILARLIDLHGLGKSHENVDRIEAEYFGEQLVSLKAQWKEEE